MTSWVSKPVTKYCSLFNFKMVLEQIFPIEFSNMTNAERVDLLALRAWFSHTLNTLPFPHALKSVLISNTLSPQDYKSTTKMFKNPLSMITSLKNSTLRFLLYGKLFNRTFVITRFKELILVCGSLNGPTPEVPSDRAFVTHNLSRYSMMSLPAHFTALKIRYCTKKNSLLKKTHCARRV